MVFVEMFLRAIRIKIPNETSAIEKIGPGGEVYSRGVSIKATLQILPHAIFTKRYP